MTFSLAGGKERSRSSQTMNQTMNQSQTNRLSDRAAGMLMNGMDRLGGRTFQGTTAADIDRFRNPYEQEVIDATMADLGHQRGVARAGLLSDVGSAGAFGDKRRGILEAELEGQLDRTTAQTLANMRAQGFDRALGAAQGETATRSQFDLAIEELLARYAAAFGNEGTTQTNGTTTGTQTGRSTGTSLGFSFSPFQSAGGR